LAGKRKNNLGPPKKVLDLPEDKWDPSAFYYVRKGALYMRERKKSSGNRRRKKKGGR